LFYVSFTIGEKIEQFLGEFEVARLNKEKKRVIKDLSSGSQKLFNA
jgi:hypothetical protein